MKTAYSARYATAIGALGVLVFVACHSGPPPTLVDPAALAPAAPYGDIIVMPTRPRTQATTPEPAMTNEPAPQRSAETTTPTEPAATTNVSPTEGSITTETRTTEAVAATPTTPITPTAPEPETSIPRTTSTDPIDRIKDEGLNHSQAMDTLSYLSDVIGPRLTGSPNLKRANEWTKDKLEGWGLTNAHLEPWGPFGRGWEVKRFSAQVIEPQAFPVIAYPLAWSPGYDHPIEGDVIYIDLAQTTNLDQYKDIVKGAIVFINPPKPLTPPFQPLATRLTDSNLLTAADSTDDLDFFGMPRARGGRGGRGGLRAVGGGGSQLGANRITPARLLSFLTEQQVGVVATISGSTIVGGTFDSGTVLVQQATVPQTGNGGGFGGRGSASAYATNAPEMPPQIVLAVESYNRIIRMLKAGEKVRMQVDLEVKYHTEDLMAYNTVAEIPGTDLKDELVMLGGHMDSWPAGTGATDNGVGVAACMEAVRIIEAAGLKPRRTIRIALWTGEEEGLLGSRAYVTEHFGSNPRGGRGGGGGGRRGRGGNAGGTNAAPETAAGGGAAGGNARGAGRGGFIQGPEYEKLSAYFNLDNGGGRIRGIFMEQNEAVRPIFQKWMEPFRTNGAETLTLSRTGSTDHVSFDSIGLPGFQFLQDPMDYFTHTHHTSQDVFDRISGDDLKQAATIMAAFVYDAATADDKLPRKPRN